MNKLILIVIIFLFLSCGKNTSEHSTLKKDDEQSGSENINFKPELVSNFILHLFKSEIIDSLEIPMYIKVTLIDAEKEVNPDSLELISAGKERKLSSTFYDQIRMIKSQSTFLIDNNYSILNINSIDEGTNIVDFKIIILNINDTSSIVLVTNFINPEFGDGTLYYLGIKHNKDIVVKKRTLLWAN